MDSYIDQAQFDRLAAIIEDSFGAADEQGKVLFSVPDRLWDGDQISLPPVSEEENFFQQEGFCFYRCAPGGRVLYLFKRTDTDLSCTLRVLRLVAYTLEEPDRPGQDAAAFLRELLILGETGVSPVELQSREDPRVFGYTTVSVAASLQENSGDTDLIRELLRNIFPSEQGYQTVPMGEGKFVIVCPVGGENDMKDICSMAELIHDTLISEIMVSARVSVGTIRGRLGEIDLSYSDALKAAEIGTLFELPQRCYSYNQLGIYRLIYELDTEICLQFLKETLGGGFFRDKSGPELLATLRVFLDSNMNISEASRALYIHRNTLLYRMDKFHKLTGLDASRFDDGVRIRMACTVIKYLEKTAPEELLGYIALYRKK